MDGFGRYIYSVLAVCICCGIFRRIVGEKGRSASVIHTICAIILAITVISPVVKINSVSFEKYLSDMYIEANAVIQESTEHNQEEWKAIISQKVRAYILEKASLYDCRISDVEVVLSSDQVPIPESVRITGTFSPYVRNKLTDIIEVNLGIPKEDQRWNYQN